MFLEFVAATNSFLTKSTATWTQARRGGPLILQAPAPPRRHGPHEARRPQGRAAPASPAWSTIDTDRRTLRQRLWRAIHFPDARGQGQVVVRVVVVCHSQLAVRQVGHLK